MGLAQYQGHGLRARANLHQDVSSITEKTTSSSIFRRLVTRESCKEDNSCAAASAGTNLIIPIVVAIMYASTAPLLF